MPNEPMSADTCPHKRLNRWISSDGTTFAYCAKCSKKFGPHKTWEEVRIEAGRKPSISYKDKLIASTLQAAADRHCTATCRPSGYSDADYHCRICPDRKVILAPLDKTDKGE